MSSDPPEYRRRRPSPSQRSSSLREPSRRAILTPWFLLAVCLLAAALRFGVGASLLSHGGPAFVLSSDDGDAYDAAARWQAFDTPITLTERMAGKWDLASESVTERWPRGYWMFLAGQYRVFGSAYASTLVLQAVIGALGLLGGYVVALQVLPSKTGALLSAILMALSSTSIYLSSALFAESLYIPFLLIALALVFCRSRWALLAAGVTFGGAELVRPLAIAVFGVALAWLLATRGWRSALWLTVGFAIPLALIHDPTVFTAGARAALGDHNASTDSTIERAFTLFLTGGWPPLGEPPIATNLALRVVEWLLAFAGMVYLALRVRTAAVWLLLGASLAIVVPPLIVGLPLVRYRAPADPLFIICMVAALHAAWTARRWPVRLPHWSVSPSRP